MVVLGGSIHVPITVPISLFNWVGNPRAIQTTDDLRIESGYAANYRLTRRVELKTTQRNWFAPWYEPLCDILDTNYAAPDRPIHQPSLKIIFGCWALAQRLVWRISWIKEGGEGAVGYVHNNDIDVFELEGMVAYLTIRDVK
jgi:hypothetical protein